MKRIAFVVTMLAVAGCADGGSPSAPLQPPAPDGLLLSNAVATPAVANTQIAFSSAHVAYVSASPGTFPGATLATISNKTSSGTERTVAVFDGGFDPVAIPSEQGDEISLKIVSTAGSISYILKVPPRKRPGVVRTSPASGRVDVALNVMIEVVFSETIDKATVSTQSLQLLESGQPVKGQTTVSDDGLVAQFIPDQQLNPLTTYTLVATQGIHDVEGDAPDAPFTTVFTTSGFAPGGTFPALSKPGQIYLGSESLYDFYFNSHGGHLLSRYILYDDGTFTLQYVSPRWGFFEYKGWRALAGSTISLEFNANTPTWHADATLIGDVLAVKYNLDMQFSDFVDGEYVKQ